MMMSMSEQAGLRPFWRYYGGKWRSAPHYPRPEYGAIIEPFAGAAGYALRYPDRAVTLVERYGVIAAIWRYLIRVPEAEVRRVPTVQHTDDLPGWVPEEARHLVGFWMNTGVTRPCRQLSAGRLRLSRRGRIFEGWTPATRERVAGQVGRIRHWRVVEGDYTAAPNVTATWFIDPPYNNQAGVHYVHGPGGLDYRELAAWCRDRRGQVMVCENVGADWLPFRPFMRAKAGPTGSGFSDEALWESGGEEDRPYW